MYSWKLLCDNSTNDSQITVVKILFCSDVDVNKDVYCKSILTSSPQTFNSYYNTTFQLY